MSASPMSDEQFVTEWNGLEAADRKRIRRLARIGRPQADRADAELAVGFVAHQTQRPWYRWFWVWFVPVMILGVLGAATIHPIVIGIVGGLGANAFLVRFNFGRVAKVNAGILG